MTTSRPALRRQLGIFGATMMGLGSIIGTGVFVSIGIAAGVAGPAVILAIAFAAVVATCNALNSAQLAASHPVSGGTYEYGYRYLSPWAGFTAGWMFLCAKSASAATAALGFAGYGLGLFAPERTDLLIPIALAAVIGLTLLVVGGIRLSSVTNIVIVSVTLTALLAFCIAGLPTAISSAGRNLAPFFQPVADETTPVGGLLQATALMFVAFTGYGRIATLSEEVREPRRTIPRAIVLTLIVSALLYMAVGVIGVGAVGAGEMAAATQAGAAPLQTISRRLSWPAVEGLVAVGAVTAMLGVLLNLLLGLSRVLLAMGRRRDVPPFVAQVSAVTGTPTTAVLLVGGLIAALVLIGNVKTTWSFSAFTVLIYYALTNWAALRLPDESRLFSRGYGYGGLLACLFLAFWVEPAIWIAGMGLVAAGLLWHTAAQRIGQHRSA